MKTGLVSIVLPIYNVEKYLNRCMESIINRTYKNIEIIMVDDGSTDSSPQICDEWQNRDKRVKVIHKKNAGLGMARNTGIENAQGDYVCFFDSDDFVMHETIERLVETAVQEHADIVIYGYRLLGKQGKVIYTRIPKVKQKKYTGQEILELFLPDLISKNPHTGEDTQLWMSACGALFSLDMINNAQWRFVSEREIISEDVYSLLLLYKHVSSVYVLSEAFYNYCENDTNSLTRTFREDRYLKNKCFYEACINACENLGYSEEIKRRIVYQFLGNTIAAMKRIAICDYSYKEKILAMKHIVCDDVFCEVVKELEVSNEAYARKLLFYYIKRKKIFIVFLMFYAQAKKTLKYIN